MELSRPFSSAKEGIGLDGKGRTARNGDSNNGTYVDLLVERWVATAEVEEGLVEGWGATEPDNGELGGWINGTEVEESEMEYYTSLYLEGVLLPIIALFGIVGQY